MKKMSFRQVGLADKVVVLFLHTSADPTQQEWDVAMTAMANHAKEHDVRQLRALAITDGGGPNAIMRGQLTDLYESSKHSVRTSVITESVAVRGIVTALRWFNPHMKAFSPRHAAGALSHLELSADALPRLLRELTEMQVELPRVACLSLMNSYASTSLTGS